MKAEETWKDIKGYEGLYQVSNLGRIKSLERKVPNGNGKYRLHKERILKGGLFTRGYLGVVLCKESKNVSRTIHQLVAESFLNHKPNGHNLIVNHINFNKTDNRLENLEIISNRDNTNRKHLKSSSQYTGVSWNKRAKKWFSMIHIKGKQKYLGLFNDEYEAHIAYQKALKESNKINQNGKR